MPRFIVSLEFNETTRVLVSAEDEDEAEEKARAGQWLDEISSVAGFPEVSDVEPESEEEY